MLPRNGCPFTISPSGINTYMECPRKFLYYSRKTPGFQPPFREALDFGTVIHRIIRDYYELIPQDLVPGEVEIYLNKAKEKNREKLELLAGMEERINRQLGNFARFERDRLKWHVNPKPIAVEKEFWHGCVHGIVDAMFRKGDRIVVVDWKTGKSTATLTQSMVVQLNTYMWLTGADEAYILFLEYGNFEKLERKFDIEGMVDLMLHDRAMLPKPGDHCKLCPYQYQCMVEHGLINPDLWEEVWMD